MNQKETNDETVINPSALEPLFEPWEEPNAHRIRADKPGDPAKVVRGRRASNIGIVQNLRGAVLEWRENFYIASSDTTRQLLDYWFERPHRKKTASGGKFEFRYYFLQREAIETFIYLTEVRGIRCLSQIVYEFGGSSKEIDALGITPEEDAWSRYAFKLATGTGKTKVMSLAVVWSYFHALRESDSEMARHCVVVAPNLTVYERLKEDFGDGKIFDEDPLIPPEWRGDWNMSTVLQDDASGAATGGVLYLTNIHRLYDPKKRQKKKDESTYDFMGPAVSRAKALDTGALLRDRITSHRNVMVLNDEAHHVWDPDSAWNEAIKYLHETIKSRTGGGLTAQLDFSATPKDDKALLFKHIICDSPLGEATDAGIVKTPIIGHSDRKLVEMPDDNAAYKYENHLRLGYERWKASRDEWQKSGKKALMFVMCDSTEAADQITHRLNTDEVFKDMNGKAINLHTNLKGKIKPKGKGKDKIYEFVANEKEISDDDLKRLRQLSRELDEDRSPYYCIVSVLMLREGWDVKNVTTIVPLRPYSSKANILPEQTLGRGLRRMTVPGSQGANEIVTVVEHSAFASLYRQELAQEGLPIEIVDIDRIPATTISIFPDEANKDLKELEIDVPTMAPGHKIIPKLTEITLDEVREAFSKYRPLPLGSKGNDEIEYEGRHLITGEVVERMKLSMPLLETGIGAVSYFVKQLEVICKIPNLHKPMASLMQTFLEEILFERKSTLYDQSLISRLADSDVAEHIRAVFVPLIRNNSTTVEERIPAGEPMRLSSWKPYQVTRSERRPAIEARRTLFNLVSCNRELEVGMSMFSDKAPDVSAFAKNAGPQCLRVDYLAAGARLAFYTPDFFIRTNSGKYYLVETKGREDKDVPRKARAAMEWCKSASKSGIAWEYLYVPQGVFESETGNTIEGLVRTCSPALQDLIEEEKIEERFPLFAGIDAEEVEKSPELEGIVEEEVLNSFPPRYKRAIEQAALLYKFMQTKKGMSYSPVFNALLGVVDESAKGLIVRKLGPSLPSAVQDQKAWFRPYLDFMSHGDKKHYEGFAQNLKRTLVFNNGFSPLGLLRNCLDYATQEEPSLEGVFEAIKVEFRISGARALLDTVSQMNDFRNTYVAHQSEELADPELALEELKRWIEGIEEIVSV